MKRVIVILGACYARTVVAASLCKHIGKEVLLIDKNPYHPLVQQIHYVASGVKDHLKYQHHLTLSLMQLRGQ
jgi:NADH dehydrogenase FAD-containing subunit